MNRHRYIVIIFIATLAILGGCQMDPCGSGPADLIENMEDLVKEARDADYEVKSDQWDPLDERFRKFYEECYEIWRPDMTFAQKKEFAGLATRYATQRFGRSIFRSIFDGKKSDPETEQEFFENLGKDLDRFMEENREWGKEFFDDLLNQFDEGDSEK